jgi:D-alanyl-D-alanine dipeptidase
MATAERLSRALPAATLRPDPGVIEAVRAVKTEAEVAAIRAACGDAGKIYPLVAERLRVGVSEIELSRDVLKDLRRQGVKPVGDLIQGGQTASVPHRQAGQRRLQSGDAVIVDFVCERDGYLADLTRTLSLGQPGEEIGRAYGLVRDAQRRAIETVRPGVSCEAVDRAARSVIEAAGLGAYFVHRVGHGIGLDVHEAPFLVQGNQQPLAPGMCVTIEPGVYLPGRFGIRIEDVVAVTEDGCEILSDKVPTDVSPAFC